LFVDYTSAVQVIEVEENALERGWIMFKLARELYYPQRGL
jgi:hypothetical protein